MNSVTHRYSRLCCACPLFSSCERARSLPVGVCTVTELRVLHLHVLHKNFNLFPKKKRVKHACPSASHIWQGSPYSLVFELDRSSRCSSENVCASSGTGHQKMAVIFCKVCRFLRQLFAPSAAFEPDFGDQASHFERYLSSFAQKFAEET